MGAGTSFFYYSKLVKIEAEQKMKEPRKVRLHTFGWPLNAAKMTNRRLCHLSVKGFTIFNIFARLK